MGLILRKSNININTALLLLVYRALLIVFERDYSRDSWINLSIPLLFFVIFSFKNHKFDYIFYMIVGILVTMFGSNDNFAGSVLFFISMYDNKKKTNVIINIIFILISLRVKMLVGLSETSNIFSFIIVFYFVIAHMYTRFWSIADTEEKHCENKGLTPEQIATIDMLLKGLTHKESAELLNIERKTYTARVASLRKRFNAKSDFLLSITLVKEGFISLNTLAYANIDDKTLNKDTKL